MNELVSNLMLTPGFADKFPDMSFDLNDFKIARIIMNHLKS